MKQDDIYCVKRMRLLYFLVKRGFRDYEVVPDPTSTKGYNWFLFKKTPGLDAAVDEYFEQFK